MKKSLYILFVLLLLAGSFLAGSWYSHREPARGSASGVRRVLYYVDPMNPSHTSDKPGLAPMRHENGAGLCRRRPGAGFRECQFLMPPGTVKISPEKQQIIGVQMARGKRPPEAIPFACWAGSPPMRPAFTGSMPPPTDGSRKCCPSPPAAWSKRMISGHFLCAGVLLGIESLSLWSAIAGPV